MNALVVFVSRMLNNIPCLVLELCSRTFPPSLNSTLLWRPTSRVLTPPRLKEQCNEDANTVHVNDAANVKLTPRPTRLQRKPHR